MNDIFQSQGFKSSKLGTEAIHNFFSLSTSIFEQISPTMQGFWDDQLDEHIFSLDNQLTLFIEVLLMVLLTVLMKA